MAKNDEEGVWVSEVCKLHSSPSLSGYKWADGGPESLRDQPRGLQTFSVKSQTGTVLGLPGHTVSVTESLFLRLFLQLLINEKITLTSVCTKLAMDWIWPMG